jgi:hypothetical protein
VIHLYKGKRTYVAFLVINFIVTAVTSVAAALAQLSNSVDLLSPANPRFGC